MNFIQLGIDDVLLLPLFTGLIALVNWLRVLSEANLKDEFYQGLISCLYQLNHAVF